MPLDKLEDGIESDSSESAFQKHRISWNPPAIAKHQRTVDVNVDIGFRPAVTFKDVRIPISFVDLRDRLIAKGTCNVRCC